MEKELFDRETVLDLTVNFIPLAILLVFVVLYLVMNPFGVDSVISSIQFAIIGTMFVALAVLTYYSGAAVSRAEKETEAAELEAEAEAAELEEDGEEELEGDETAELEGEPEEEGSDDAAEADADGDDGDEDAADGDDENESA
jgi:nucleotide-binding universal stress UspA family protein